MVLVEIVLFITTTFVMLVLLCKNYLVWTLIQILFQMCMYVKKRGNFMAFAYMHALFHFSFNMVTKDERRFCADESLTQAKACIVANPDGNGSLY